MSDNSKHAYYANAIGFTALCLLFALMVKSCSEVYVEQEKTRQLEIMNTKK